MDKSNNVDKGSFLPAEDNEEFLCLEVLHLTAIEILMYNCIRLDIVFSINLLVRF